MDVFYHFANDQKILREVAFTYWESYYALLYIIFFGVLSGVSTGLAGIAANTDFVWAYLLPIVISILASWEIEKSLKPKILRHAINQVDTMIINNVADFKQQIDLR